MTLTVIIPVKNGAQTLDKCLQKIRTQTLPDIEIIVLDSMSTDGSREIALKQHAKVIDVPAGTFNHGLTRNLGVQHASAGLIYFTVQDAWIAEEDMLQKMVNHFEDAAVQSVTGMQATPHEADKNPVKWFKRFTPPIAEERVFKAGEFKNLTPEKQLLLSRWDNVNAMYRKQALMQQPFAATGLAEDIIWAQQALQKGWKMVNDSSLLVYHYHHHGFGYTFKISYAEYNIVNSQFSLLPPFPPALSFFKSLNTLAKNKSVPLIKKGYWAFHNAGIFSAQLLAVITFRLARFAGGQKLVDKGLHFFCAETPQGKQATL